MCEKPGSGTDLGTGRWLLPAFTHSAWPPCSPHTEHPLGPLARLWRPGAGHIPLALTWTGVSGGLLLALELTAGKGQLPEGTVRVRQVAIRSCTASTCTLAVELGQSRCSSPAGQVPHEAETPCSARHGTPHRRMNPPPLPVSRRSSPGSATREDTWGPALRRCWGRDLHAGPQTVTSAPASAASGALHRLSPSRLSTCHTRTCAHTTAHTYAHGACTHRCTQARAHRLSHTGSHTHRRVHTQVRTHRRVHTETHTAIPSTWTLRRLFLNGP